MDKHNYLHLADISSIEGMYKEYSRNPELLDNSWKRFFEGFEFAQKHYGNNQTSEFDKEFKVLKLIEGYRRRGHFFTLTNPVRQRRKYDPTLDIENFGLTVSDLETSFMAGSSIGIGPAKLSEIIGFLKETYCRSIGSEYMYIRKPVIQEWLIQRIENNRNTPAYSNEQKKRIFQNLNVASGFESFIHKKFIGQKRFSLEGAEALIPALNTLIQSGADKGLKEFVLGMPHRGRLNVLANVMQKPYDNIFTEFLGKSYDESITLGDVKYHLGYDSVFELDGGKSINLSLAPNPSHLESVDPIVEGISRAIIDQKYRGNYRKLCPVLIHGDAAIAGQGLVYEVLQMSQLPGYKTGGTIHFIINNQVGFTTNYLDARSSTYCTDVAKVTLSPVFHVNGDDVEAIVHTVELALDFRQEFNQDVFIDILCYRKYGHNEGDEPRFTQPLLYDTIAKHPNTRDIYAKHLIETGVCSKTEIEKAISDFNKLLEDKLALVKPKIRIKKFLFDYWKNYSDPKPNDFLIDVKTGINKEKLIDLANVLNHQPEGMKFIKKLSRITDDRKTLIANNKVDWALAELLAYASLVDEGKQVRLSGQDSERGTFAHRHASFYIEDTEQKHTPLKHISNNQAPFYVFNSPLNEYGVLGFEYGYALASPDGLTIWEAQFGDFHNVAQVMVDQYISSAYEKWGLMNGLVMMLPHGFEGQGPEHSSARLERFLLLSVNNNMQIVNCTTPANLFHVLRRQQGRSFRIPLIIFTPKSLLRHPLCISSLDDLENGTFQKVIDDAEAKPENVKRLVFCSGKIYYELLAKKTELNAQDVAIVRIEEIHPFPHKTLNTIIKKYKHALLKLWVQEEPENMGAWSHINYHFKSAGLVPVARVPSASPAHGLSGLHELGQNEIISKVFRKCNCELKNDYCNLACVEGKSHHEILKQHQYFDSELKFSI
jgi:2-oxoglutarate dehydrogenase E1 component